METENLNSFTIGTPATGGSLKVYFKGLDTNSETLIKRAIAVYNLIIKGGEK